MVSGGNFSAKQRALLSSYLLNLWRGPEAVRTMMVLDFRSCVDLGASARAADLLFVLQRFLTVCPEARLDQSVAPEKWYISLRQQEKPSRRTPNRDRGE